MSEAASSSPKPHLRAALIALALMATLALLSLPVFEWTVEHRFLEMLETPLPMKNQGQWIQRTALGQKDVFPVYGSSEMAVVMRDRPDEFFHSMPTGFRVCPVGAPGSTSFLIAQKIASIGDATRGKKIAIILSATWFCRPGVPDDSYAGNFSPLQAGSILLADDLDDGLRDRYVKRMLDFPGTLSSNPLLGTYARHAGQDGEWPAAVCAVLNPLLRMSLAGLVWEDHFATSTAAVNFDRVKPRHGGTEASGADFEHLISAVEDKETPQPDRNLRTTEGGDDARFVADMNASKEWDDLTLLLDTLKHFEVKALILSVPLPGRYYDQQGVSHDAREHFYKRLHSTCAEHGFPCFDFSEHERDEDFTLPHSSHFSEKGWLYVDRVLDDFYHDRPVAAGSAGNSH